MKPIIASIIVILLPGCFPVYKTLQPNSAVTVVDVKNRPIKDTMVYLVSNAYPYGAEKTRASAFTGTNGKVSFAAAREWRVESLMLHGAEFYFWNWCIVKEGYQTQATAHRSKRGFKKKRTFVLSEGESLPCPEYQ